MRSLKPTERATSTRSVAFLAIQLASVLRSFEYANTADLPKSDLNAEALEAVQIDLESIVAEMDALKRFDVYRISNLIESPLYKELSKHPNFPELMARVDNGLKIRRRMFAHWLSTRTAQERLNAIKEAVRSAESGLSPIVKIRALTRMIKDAGLPQGINHFVAKSSGAMNSESPSSEGSYLTTALTQGDQVSPTFKTWMKLEVLAICQLLGFESDEMRKRQWVTMKQQLRASYYGDCALKAQYADNLDYYCFGSDKLDETKFYKKVESFVKRDARIPECVRAAVDKLDLRELLLGLADFIDPESRSLETIDYLRCILLDKALDEPYVNLNLKNLNRAELELRMYHEFRPRLLNTSENPRERCKEIAAQLLGGDNGQETGTLISEINEISGAFDHPDNFRSAIAEQLRRLNQSRIANGTVLFQKYQRN